MWPGPSNPPGGYQYSWTVSWTIAVLPYVEQTPMYNAFNFAWSNTVSNPGQQYNYTVCTTQPGFLICPSENVNQRIISPFGVQNYVSNLGGPGSITYYSGSVVPSNMYGNAIHLGADQCAPFGVEGITDGTSNTALFSERLHGLPYNLQGSAAGTVYPGGTNFKRGVFLPPTGVTITPGSGNVAQTLAWVQACRSLPATVSTSYTWLDGFFWAGAHPTATVVNSYTHFNTPNGLTCYSNESGEPNVGDVWGMPSGAIPPTSNHPGGVNMTFCDGSVKFIKDSIGFQTFWALGTKNMAEVVSSDQY
jgi:prepilin-type processing-associated H-X9-DG protein